MKPDFDLIGVGIGPFNLSLAALLSPMKKIRTQFFDQKSEFNWHSEIMFKDSIMQTSYLKDLVTPVDPTNPNSFINYLVQHGLFYAHLNTSRNHITRREFEMYCKWVCKNIKSQLSFTNPVMNVTFRDELFHVETKDGTFLSKNICVGTGLSQWTPEFAAPYLSDTCFHAKSPKLAQTDLTGKRVVIIGGGQTGLEIFTNAFKGKWGNPAKVSLISRRHTLEPLDETPFTNEYFTPRYVKDFFGIDNQTKPDIVHHQRFASDGNTPSYLQDLYNELYYRQHIEGSLKGIHILPQRQVMSIEKQDNVYRLSVANHFTSETEHTEADIVILSTGFKNVIPKCLEPIKDLLNLQNEKFDINENFAVKWQHAGTNKIYALNFGRHSHGIAEPQTSLMAWRSGMIINDLMNETVYPGVKSVANFIQHGTFKDA